MTTVPERKMTASSRCTRWCTLLGRVLQLQGPLQYLATLGVHRQVRCLFTPESGLGLHSLRVGWRNLPTLRVGWRNFFSSYSVVSVFGSGGKQVLVLHTTYVLRVSYHIVVVLCQFFGFGGKQFLVLRTYLVICISFRSVGGKLAVFLLWQKIFITTGKKRYITTGKKRYSRLSDGCAVLDDRKKKIQSSVSCRDRYICISST